MPRIKTTVTVVLGTALSLVVPLTSPAQSRNAGFAPARAPMSVRSSSFSSPGFSSFGQPRPTFSNRVAPRVAGVGTPLYPNFAPIPFRSKAVPGLGFNYEHLVAVSPSSRDRFGHLRSGRVITPIFFGGLPYYGDPYYGDYGGYDGAPMEPQPQPAQPLFILQTPQGIPQGDPVAPAPQVTNAAPEAHPVPDAGEFILVRRDGQVAMAVAFTTAGGRLTYISREGTRRSFALSELDKDATVQMNEANGTTLTLPN